MQSSALSRMAAIAAVMCLLSFGASWSPLSAVSAQNVAFTAYSDLTCTVQTNTYSAQTAANGQCIQAQAVTTKSQKQYCGNGQYLTYTYYDTACTQLSSILYSPVGVCTQYSPGDSSAYIATCPAGATAPPITFPPTDNTWQFNSQCSDTACTSNCVVTTAIKLGTCYSDVSMSYGRDVLACTADGAASVLMTYNASVPGGSTCTGSPFAAQVSPNNFCRSGFYTSCPASTSVTIPQLPAIGYYNYDSADADCTSPTRMNMYAPHACDGASGGATYSCSASGDSVTVQNYYTKTSTGVCSGAPFGSSSYATNQCSGDTVYNCSMSISTFLTARANAMAASDSSTGASSTTGSNGAGGTTISSTGGQDHASSTGAPTNPAGAGNSYSASVVFLLSFNAAATVSTVQSDVATMAGVSTQQVAVVVLSSSRRRMLSASSQLQVTISTDSTTTAQSAFQQFNTAFSSTAAGTNPLLTQSVDQSATPVAVYSVTCADGSTKASSTDCNTVSSAASSSVTFSWVSLAMASSVAMVVNAGRV